MTKRTRPPQPTAEGAFAIGASLVQEKLDRLQALAGHSRIDRAVAEGRAGQ